MDTYLWFHQCVEWHNALCAPIETSLQWSQSKQFELFIFLIDQASNFVNLVRRDWEISYSSAYLPIKICLPFHSTLKYQLLNSFEIRVQKKSNAISFFMRCFAQETLAISEKTHVKILQKLAKGTWEILGEVIQWNISISINIGITVYAAPMMIGTSVEWFRKSVQVPKSYVWAQSSFFVKQKRLLNQGPSSSGSQMQLQSGFLLWNSPGANSISQPQQENIPEKRRYHQLVTCDVRWSNLNISMAASKGLSLEPSISCHLTETSPSGIWSISATWK